MVTVGSQVSTYLARIDKLSVKAGSVTPTEVNPSTKEIHPWIAGVTPYTPFLVSAIIFLCVFWIIIAKKVRSAKNLIAALVIALFAVSMTQVLTYVSIGDSQSIQASIKEIPLNIQITRVSSGQAHITWDTEVENLGVVRYSQSPFSEIEAKMVLDNNLIRAKKHEAIMKNLEEGKSYELEILSGTTWYNDAGHPVRFAFH